MRKLNLRVPPALADDLKQIAELGTEPLEQLVASLDTAAQTLVKPADLRKAIISSVPKEAAGAVEKLLIGLSTLRRDSDASIEDIFAALGEAGARFSWKESLLRSWQAVQAPLRALLEKPSVSATAKAVDLLYDYDHFFSSAKILTDIRPVFDDSKTKMVGATVNQTFRLQYSDGAGTSTDISLIIDLDDIERLRKLCDEAIQKERIVREQLNQKMNIATITLDEVKNDGF